MKRINAYMVMDRYLSDTYFRTKMDDLGGILGEMAMGKDFQSRDPAAYEDWKDICPADVEEKEVLSKVTAYLRLYAGQLSSKELSSLADKLEKDKQSQEDFNNNYLWKYGFDI